MLSMASMFLYPSSSRISYSNNEDGDEALIIGLISTLQMEICRFCVQGDSRIFIKQVNEGFALKEIALLSYQTAVQKLIKSFQVTWSSIYHE